MTKYYYHTKLKCYFAVVDDDFDDVGIDRNDCKEVSKLVYDKSFIQRKNQQIEAKK